MTPPRPGYRHPVDISVEHVLILGLWRYISHNPKINTWFCMGRAGLRVTG